MPTINCNGLDLYYESEGAGTPVVFLHGGGGDIAQWRFQVPVFSKTHRVIVFDLRGHGRSETSTAECRMRDFADDLGALVRGLDLGPVHLVGLTMGAMIAINFALEHAELTRSLTLIGGTLGGNPTMVERFETSAFIAENQGMEMLAEGFASVVFSEEFSKSHPEVVADTAQRIRASSPLGFARAIRAFAQRPSVRDRLSEIKAPTLVVAGEKDVTVFPLEDMPVFTEEIPNAKAMKIPAAGHLASLEQADVFNRHLAEFLKRVEEESG